MTVGELKAARRPPPPPSKKEIRRSRERAWLWNMHHAINHVAATKYQGKRNARTLAEQYVADAYGMSHPALQRMRTRYRGNLG